MFKKVKKIIEFTRRKCADNLPEKVKKHIRPIYYSLMTKNNYHDIYSKNIPVNNFDEIISLEDIKKIISREDVKVVSFDIFDTLLVRPVLDPTDIFYLIAQKVNLKYNIDFFKIRISAEKELNKENCNIFDIYNYIKDKNNLDQKVIDSLIKEEMSCEKHFLTERFDLKELYNFSVSLGKKIICSSDMYLPSDFLREVLEEKGFNSIDNIYVSNENQGRKDNGLLYKYILKSLNLKENNIVHIGDNYHSDYKVPLNLGILSFYYPSNKDLFLCENSPFSKVFNGFITKDPYTKILFGFLVNKLFSNRSFYKNKGEVIGDLDIFATVCVFPAALYSCLEILQNKKIQNNFNKIFFASRDGFLPQKIYDILNKSLNFSGVPSEYLLVGRRAYYMALEKNFFNYLKNKPVDRESFYTLENIIDCYILDKSLNLKIKQKISKEFLSLDFGKDRDKSLSVLGCFENEINSYIDTLKNNAISYYKEKFLDVNRGVVFDLGYSGSVSDALFKLTSKRFDKIYLWETKKNKKLDKKNKTNTFVLFKHRHPTEHIILEEMFSPLSGGCVGFLKNDKNEIIPMFEDISFSKEMEEDLNRVQKMVLDLTLDFSILFQGYLDSFKIKDVVSLQKIGWYSFSESEYGEENIFKNIVFPDSIYLSHPESLSEKILKHRQYKDVFDGTGFNNPKKHIDTVIKKDVKTNLKIAIHVHLYNLNLYNEIMSYLKDFPFVFDLFVTINTENKKNIAEKIFNKKMIKNVNETYFIITPNRGRDVAPWLLLTKSYQKNYDLFCHIHSKESVHFDFSKKWRNYLFKNLISRDAVVDIIDLFENDPKLGVVFPDAFVPLKYFILNFNIPLEGETVEPVIINDLIKKMNISGTFNRTDVFYSLGTMFWYRTESMKPLFDLNLKLEDFPEEPIGVGGTIAHAIERLPSVVSESQGFKSRFYTKFK